MILLNKEVEFDSILQEDIEILAGKISSLGCLNGKTVLVTGASGLLGSQLVKAFLCCNRIYNSNISVIALCRSAQNAEIAFGRLVERERFKIIISDIKKPLHIEENVDYIMHAAGITGNSKKHLTNPADTINTAVLGTYNVLEFAREKNIAGFVYFSTLEVYGQTDPEKDWIYENDYGYIDILQPRSSYKESKRLCENMCLAYNTQYGVAASIGRLALTFGPGIRDNDNRVFAQFARSVINKQDIVLKTTGETLRNHCYIRDALWALIIIMVKGARGEAYNIANQNTAMTIIDMAKMVAGLFEESKINVRIEPDSPEKYGYTEKLKCLLNSDKLSSLGWNAEVDLKDMFIRTIKSMKGVQGNDFSN